MTFDLFSLDAATILSDLKNHLMLANYVKNKLIEDLTRNVLLETAEIVAAESYFFRSKSINIQESDAKQLYMKKHGLSESELQFQIQLSAKIKKYALSHYENESKSLFFKSKSSFDVVEYNLVRVSDKGLAYEIYFKLQTGESDFASLARDFSSGPEKNTQGVIGPSALGRAHPRLISVLSKASSGQLLEPFDVMGNWLVVKLISYKEASFNEELATRLSLKIFKDKVDKMANDLISSESFAQILAQA